MSVALNQMSPREGKPHLGKSDVFAGLRPPERVCKLDRMGAAFPTRLSFMRLLLRRMSSEGWQMKRGQFELDESGYGTAVYTAQLPDRA